MFKEIKYLIYLLVIAFFFIFSVRYYISDDYKKNYYRGLESHKDKTITYAKNLPTLKNDTNNIIVYKNDLEEFNKKRKKRFWEKLIPN